MVTGIKKMLYRSVQELRERMGLTLIDLQWLTGSMQRKWKVDDTSEIEDPSFAIFIRYLNLYPNENPLPKMPEFSEMESMLNIHWDRNENKKFCIKRLGPLFGCSPLAGYKWNTNIEPSQIVRHMMLIVANAIKKDGQAGLERYIDVVKQEAMARGISMEELWNDGWRTFSRRREAELAEQKKNT